MPDVLKIHLGVVVPIYKGGGKDPLKVDSDQGITITSIASRSMAVECVFAPHLNLGRCGAWLHSYLLTADDVSELEYIQTTRAQEVLTICIRSARQCTLIVG